MDKISKKNKTMKIILKIKKLLQDYNLDAYIVPKNDEFFSEYAFPNRLKTVSNFTGSAGFCIITKSENYLFVDGRYLIQSKMESGKNFQINEIPYKYPKDILNNKIIKKIGYDPTLFTSSSLKTYFNFKFKLIPYKQNLIDSVFREKKRVESSFFIMDDKVVGEKISSKINRLASILKKNNSDGIFITAPENVAWLLNIRGYDNPNSPIPNCHLLLDKKKKSLFDSK